MLDGTIDDPHFLPFVYELDEREEWQDERMWIKANPGLGTIKKLSFLRQMVKKAKADSSFLPTLLVKDFNLKENAASAWLRYEHVSNSDTFDIKAFDYCIGGFDAADSIDLNAATAICMRPGDPKIYRRSMYWIPQAVLDQDARNGNLLERDGVPYRLWVDRGLMRTCSGNKVNKAVFLDWFTELQEEGLYVLYIGYDPWHIDDSLLLRFQQQFGERAMIPVRQGVKTLSQPMFDLKADLEEHKIVDNNHPIDKWCLLNMNVKTDINGNIQPIKGLDTRCRIDGGMALICAYKVLQDKMDEYVPMNKGVDENEPA